jgi:polyphosphate kinase 2
MKKLLSEVNRYRSLLGVTLNEEVKAAEDYEFTISNILKNEKVYTRQIEVLLYDILDKGYESPINLDLLERGVRNVLMKKGDKKKNITKYLQNVLKALKKRNNQDFDDGEPEPEEFTFEPQEPSMIKKKVYNKELYYLQVELLKMQEWIKKTGKTVIIVFEGRDSAGKGSTIKKFTENLNPRYYNIIALGIPTPEERKAWWDRYRNQIQKGMINFFDRSWYNRGLVEPVMGYGSPEEYEDFMNNVEDFEKDLVKDGDYLFKLWFSIDKETQAKRFQMRQQSPVKYWKYSPNDEKMQDMWDRFSEFKQKLFDKTSTVNHPWVILDANDKRVSGLNAIRYVLQNIPYEGKNNEILDKDFPEAMTVLKPEIGESKNINETEGADPKNPDSHPDLDDFGPDSWWKFEDWKTWFNASVKKYGWDRAKQNFARFWMAVEEGIGVGTTNDLDVNWLKQNGLWNEKTDKVYTRDEISAKLSKSSDKSYPPLSNNELTVYKFLRGNGFTKMGTAAIMGNIFQETSFNGDTITKKAVNDKGAPSFGLIQWRGQRFYPNVKNDVKFVNNKIPNITTNCKDKENPSRLKQLMCRYPNSFNSINTQLNFLISELSKYESLLGELKNKKLSKDGDGSVSGGKALEINKKFIRGEEGNRFKHAQSYFNKIKSEKYL